MLTCDKTNLLRHQTTVRAVDRSLWLITRLIYESQLKTHRKLDTRPVLQKNKKKSNLKRYLTFRCDLLPVQLQKTSKYFRENKKKLLFGFFFLIFSIRIAEIISIATIGCFIMHRLIAKLRARSLRPKQTWITWSESNDRSFHLCNTTLNHSIPK